MTRHCRQGHALIELLVASGISVVVVMIVIVIFCSQSGMYRRQRQLNEVNQNLRTATDIMGRDVRMAGYGLPSSDSEVSQWVDWVPGITGRIVVAQGVGGAPDTLSLTAVFHGPVTTIAMPASQGDKSIYVAVDTAPAFQAADRRLILIGRLELAQVRAVNVNQDRLHITTNPHNSSDGLRNSYPTGTSIEFVEVVTYSCRTNPTGFPNRPYVIRDNHSDPAATDLQKMIATGIENFQVNSGLNTVTVQLTGRTAFPDEAYTDPLRGDHYYRKVLTAVYYPRNQR